MTQRILIVDDEEAIRSSLAEYLAGDGFTTATAETGEAALAWLQREACDLVITDLKMPNVSGLELLQALRRQRRDTPVIMMTAYGDVDAAVEAMRLGAYDFIQKPFKLSDMRRQVRAALRATAADESGETAPARPHRPAPSRRPDTRRSYDLITACPGLKEIARILDKVGGSRAGNETSVLITGESGSGKEIVARAIHETGPNSHEPFMEINCAAVPETLLESELMGHEKGAFTDARQRKEGLFELAGRGTILLDEIGEMGILLQSRLLRVIENRTFRRVGGKEELHVEARIVAATNRRLNEAIRDGVFRNDLYYRLQVVEIHVPPLRERPEDLPVLVDHFIRAYNAELGLDTAPADAELLAGLSRYPWPGNVRELKNVLRRIMLLEEPQRLTLDHFPPHIRSGRDPRQTAAEHPASDGLLTLAEVERRQILYTLERTGNNKSQAARILGISRQTLREKLRQYERQREAAEGGD